MYKWNPNHDDEALYGERRYPSWVIVAKPNDQLPESASCRVLGPFANSVHCYTDACICYKTGIAAGAYVIGVRSPEAFVVKAVDSNTAELMTMVECLKAVEKEFRELPITLHIDLPHIASILAKPKRGGVRMELKEIADRLSVHFVADGRQHNSYRLCHRAAAVMAGKYGSRHPHFGSTEIVNRQILRDREKQSEHDRLIQDQLAAARLRSKQIKLKGGLCGVAGGTGG